MTLLFTPSRDPFEKILVIIGSSYYTDYISAWIRDVDGLGRGSDNTSKLMVFYLEVRYGVFVAGVTRSPLSQS